MWGSIFGKAVDQAIDIGKTALNYNSQKHQFADKMAFSREQFEYQKELNRNQLQWRVEDAIKAGLHPMASLGLSPAAFSPVSSPSGDGANLQLGSSDFAGLGQNVDRAIMAGKTKEQREKAEGLQDLENSLRLQNMKTQNDILKLEYDERRWKLQRALFSTQPPLSERSLIPGQADSKNPFLDKPIISTGTVLDSSGKIVGFLPSEDMKDRTEDVLGVEWAPWMASVVDNFRAKVLGHPVHGYWWHGENLGYLPFPPARSKRSKSKTRGDNGSNKNSTYYYPRSYR